MSTVHVMPINDLRRHLDSTTCWCEPQILLDGVDNAGAPARLVVHESADGREHREPDHDARACARCRVAMMPPMGSGA